MSVLGVMMNTSKTSMPAIPLQAFPYDFHFKTGRRTMLAELLLLGDFRLKAASISFKDRPLVSGMNRAHTIAVKIEQPPNKK